MNILGKIKVINPTTDISETFKKRELVVTTEEQYPQHVLIEFIQTKCSVLDDFKIGDNVNVSINIKGKEYINKDGITNYFNQIQGWKIEKVN